MEEVNKNTELNDTDKKLHISDVIKSLPSAIILAEKFAESKREHVVKCRIEKGSIANLGLYLGFIEGYNYVIEELKRIVAVIEHTNLSDYDKENK
jgi:hypothetical protein